MKFLKTHAINLIILAILAAGAWLRASWYGDLRLSVANAETASYTNSSQAPLFSWKIFWSQRLFTTNVIYKLANDPAACPFTAYSTPAIGVTVLRAVQPCFDRIAFLHNAIAIFGWCFLAWTVAKFLQTPAIKIIAATSIMLFGFTPQVAEWDSVLGPEPLSLSMFAVTLALVLEIVLRASASATPFQSRLDKGLLATGIVLFLLWVFVRDVHLYAIPITLGLMSILFFVKRYRSAKPLAISFAVLLFFFVIGFLAARDNLRATRYPLINSLDEYIWPHPSRVEFFRRFGMPERDAPNYQDWADKHATTAYGLFLATHPGFVALTLWESFDLLTSDFIQPYFYTSDIKNREALVKAGEVFHPETALVYLIVPLLALILLVHAIRLRTAILSAWTWLALWFFGIASITFFLSYFGDTAGLRRHIMPSVEMLRLFPWVFLMPFLDLSLKK